MHPPTLKTNVTCELSGGNLRGLDTVKPLHDPHIVIVRALVNQKFVPGGVACDGVLTVGVFDSWCRG